MIEFYDMKILVIGDVMIDRYLGGGISGKSPEAEVPIFSKISESNRLGGAANVALNIRNLGATALLLGITGDDKNGALLDKIVLKHNKLEGYLIKDPSRITTVKTRIISDGRHILRVDSEDTFDISVDILSVLKETFNSIINTNTLDAVIFQDYNKGMLTPNLIKYIIGKCKQKEIPLFVDPKFKNFYEYKGVTVFKPNKKELEAAVGKTLSLEEIMTGNHLEKIRESLQCELLMVTLSDEGLVYLNDEEKKHIKAFPREVADVCGAGDTVIATISLGYISGFSLKTIGLMANIAGGQVCEQSGVVAIQLERFKEEYSIRVKN